MRIISEFVDYYDCLQRTDEDRQTIYFRNEEHKPEYPMSNFYSLRCDYTLRLFSFCNRLYPHIVADRHYDGKWHRRFCYSWDDAAGFIRDHSSPDHYRRMCRRKWGILVDLRRFFDHKWTDPYPDIPVWFAGYNQKTICNPAIRAVFPQFVSIMPPAQAYQELVMWFGKRARPEPNIPAIPDEVKIEAAGFNLKTSFRRPKRES